HADAGARRRFPSLGFAGRLGLATSVLIVLVCVTQSWVLARRDLDNVRKHLTDRGRTASDALAREAAASVTHGNLGLLHQVTEHAQAENGVVYTRIFDAHGLLLDAIGDP